jgi:hypothetical protein
MMPLVDSLAVNLFAQLHARARGSGRAGRVAA